MEILEFINNVFGINNEVSAPIVITILVFLTGGLCNFIYQIFKAKQQEKDLKGIFRTMLEKIILDCEIKEKQTKRFYLTLNADHKAHWSLSFTRINYLYTIFELNFNEVFQAFEANTKFSCNKKIKKKAFHRVYSDLDNLKYFEGFIKPDIEKFINDFNNHHVKYKDSLSSFNEMMDELRFNLKGISLRLGENPIHDYAIETDKLWKKWMEVDEKERVHFKTTYEMLVEPTLVINRKFILPFILEMNKHLMESKTQYIEMENVLKRGYLTFENHNYNYRSSRRVLKKCLEILN